MGQTGRKGTFEVHTFNGDGKSLHVERASVAGVASAAFRKSPLFCIYTPLGKESTTANMVEEERKQVELDTH